MKVVKYLLLVSAVGFLLTGMFAFTQLGMGMGSSEHMSGCPLMGMPALCHMSPLEHAFTLQNVLTNIPFSGIFALLISILLALSMVLVAPVLFSIIPDLFEPHVRPPIRIGRSIPRHTLQEALSNGVLNSKAF